MKPFKKGTVYNHRHSIQGGFVVSKGRYARVIVAPAFAWLCYLARISHALLGSSPRRCNSTLYALRTATVWIRNLATVNFQINNPTINCGGKSTANYFGYSLANWCQKANYFLWFRRLLKIPVLSRCKYIIVNQEILLKANFKVYIFCKQDLIFFLSFLFWSRELTMLTI